MPTLRDKDKPSIFLLEPISREKENAKQYTKSEDALSAYAALVDAIYPVVQPRTLQAKTLDQLEAAFRSSHKLVRQTAGDYLVILTHYFGDALDRFKKIANDSKAAIRLRAIQSQFRYTVPDPFLTELLKRSLSDSSEQVRSFAASRCGQFKRTDLVELLQQQAASETSQTVLRDLSFAVEEMQRS